MLFRETVRIIFLSLFLFISAPPFSFNKSTVKIFCLILCMVKMFPLNSHEVWAFFHIKRGFISFLLESNFMTTTRAGRNYKYMENPGAVTWWEDAQQEGRIFCVWAVGTDNIHTLIQWKIHDHNLYCAAWWHSFTQRKAEQTPQPNQKPDTIKDGHLNPYGPRREISRLFSLHAKEG